MSAMNFLEKMKEIQDFLSNETDSYFHELKKMLNEEKIGKDQHTLKLILHLILGIGNNSHRYGNFF